jgi:uroporphyrinogen-III synthase
MSNQDTTAALVDHVLADGVAGRTIAVQLHGFIDEQQLRRLRQHGARVFTVAPYRWTTPADPQRVQQLITAVTTQSLDAVTFTSAPAAEALLAAARTAGRHGALVGAFRTGVTAAAVGPVTAAPLQAAGIAAIHPDRYRLGAMIRLLCTHLTAHQIHRLPTRFGTLQIRGREVTIGELPVSLGPSSLAVLRLLIDARGAVVGKDRLLAVLPETGNEHAIEAVIGRIRKGLHHQELIATVMKRGYRLNI